MFSKHLFRFSIDALLKFKVPPTVQFFLGQNSLFCWILIQINCFSSFQFFLGQRYGYREVRPSIKASEFEILSTHTQDASDAEFLKEWYVRDDNAVPPVYLLLPVTNEVKNSWNDTCKRLISMLRQAAAKAAEEGLISEMVMHEYFMSGKILLNNNSNLWYELWSPLNSL